MSELPEIANRPRHPGRYAPEGKADIANLDEDKVPYLQYAFDISIRSQLGKDDETKQGRNVPFP